ncbi:MAG: hypothetical protein KBG47_01980 [Bacteroidia bacterium]|nr:hypothetical protein [Sphingobacteriaceae bacterium]MBK7312013.1 hypothetical protein [Sphingobacteriaceae bacterium]MBK7816710.1 hypothetical protein [Sphingobacteriaceae bacterium]MBP9068247.1 hypothetical protein [Bacteroidia bacterium]
MKKIILIIALIVSSNAIKAQDAQADTSVKAERAKLSPQFSKLPGKWQFVKALQGAKDLSAEMKMFYIKKKPITLLYDKDGKITYPADAEAELKIKEGYWEFFPGAKRDLKIKTITVDGSAQESFKLVSVTEKEMIYEETRSKTKYYFKRVK